MPRLFSGWRRLLCFGLPAVALAGCRPKPVVLTPKAEPAAPAPQAAPPPAPKCEALTEHCIASGATWLAIAGSDASVQPPAGWTYAKQTDRSVAVSGDGKALLAAVEVLGSTDATVLDAIEKLSAASAIDKVNFDALKHRLKKSQITVDANGTLVDLWEVSKNTGNGSNPELLAQGSGTLLVFVARVPKERVIVGIGFVVVPDAEADAEKVMYTVQTLKGIAQ